MLTITLAFILSLPLTHAADATAELCQHREVEEFHHLNVLACPHFASTGAIARLSRLEAQRYRGLEEPLRQELKKKNIQGDVRIKIGAEQVSPEEVWFVPELALFYKSTDDLERVNELLAQFPLLQKLSLKSDQLFIVGVLQGYVGQLKADGTLESETFLTAEEWPWFEGDERASLLRQLLHLTEELKVHATLEGWREALINNLPRDHQLDWTLIEARSARKLRLSTYFDYQWYSGQAPDNNTLVSELIEEFETDLVHSPQQ